MNATRRRFLSTAAGMAAAWSMSGEPGHARGGEPPAEQQATGPTKEADVRQGDELQRALDAQQALGGGTVRLIGARAIECHVNQAAISGETSIHALLIPAGVELDLAGSTLLLDLRSNSYGVRLSSRSAIRNGVIKIVHSEGKGSQAIWHSAVSVGAAYGDGGTVARPGHFSSVTGWRIENLTIDQPVEAACIQLMSAAQHGVIRNIRILDSDKALLGIGLDWGTVGPVSTADELVPQMRALWEMHEISSTHPHHVLIEDITVGKLARSVDGNDAAVRCSGCHHITIKNLTVESAMSAVALFGGDFGFEFAPDEQLRDAHAGYVIDGIRIKEARRYGIVINGAEDNVYRSMLNFGYKPLRDPVHPGLDRPVIRNATLRGTRAPHSRGVYIAAATGAKFTNVDVENFEIGVAVNDWVRSFSYRNGRIANNQQDVRLEGSVDPPVDAAFADNASR